MQRILANGDFSQHAKLNMAGFVLYLLDHFGLRWRMVELHLKARKIEPPRGIWKGRQRPWKQQSAYSQNQEPFTAKPLHGAGAEDAKDKNQGLPLIHGKPGQVNGDGCGFMMTRLKCTPIWVEVG
jgi:hypothetical protein